MADGSIIIEIEGDADDLEESLEDAAKAAEDLEDAFDDVSDAADDATDEVDDLADAVDDVDESNIDDAAEAAEDLADAADDAADEVEDVADALDDVDGSGMDDASAAAAELGDSAGAAAVDVADVASNLDSVDGSEMDSAAGAADDLAASADDAASSADDLAGALDDVDGSGMDDAAGAADDLEGSADGAASAAEDVASALADIDGSTLSDAAGEADKLTASLEGVGGNITKMLGGDMLGGLKGMLGSLPIPKAALAMGGLGAAAIAAGGAIAAGVSSLADYGDHIDKMSQKLGISANAYQEWEAILQHSGTSIDAFRSSFKTLSNAAADGSKSTTEAFKKLGLSIQDVQKMSKEDLFKTVITRLQQMEDGTERTAIGADLLGRGIMELGPLLNTSAEDTEAMRQAVHDLGGVMSDEAVKAAATFQDTLQDLQTAASGVTRTLLAEFMPLGTQIMQGLMGALQGAQEILSPIIEGAKQQFAQLKETINNTFSPEQQAAISQFFSTLASVLVSLPIAVVTTAFTLLTGVFDLLVQGGAAVVGFFQSLPSPMELASSAATVAGSAFDSMKQTISTAVEHVKTAVSTAFNNIKTSISTAVDNAKTSVSTAFDGIRSAVSTAVETVRSAVQTAFDAAKTAISTAVESARSTVQTAFDGIRSAIQTAVDTAKSAVDTVFNGIQSTIGTTLNGALSTVQSVFGNIQTAISDKINSARDAVEKAIERIKSAFNFSWKLPHLALPHISISGSFSINPPSAPHFSIAWYKKGGVMMSPTLFGMAGGTMLGGGEAGPEAIAPIAVLQDYVEDAVSDGMRGFIDKLRSVVEQQAGTISETLSGRYSSDSPGDTYGGTTINVMVSGAVDNRQKARDVGRELGAETAREMRRRGLAPA